MQVKYSWIVTGLLVIAITIIVLLLTCKHLSWIKDGQVVVTKATYDSLVAIANRPPKIDTVIIHDTVPGEPIIKWKDKLIPVYVDSLSAVYSDTLKTKHFKVTTTDTLQYNRIVFRKYEYETYIDTIRITKEVEKPVFVDRPVPVPKVGWYYGASVDFYKIGFDLKADVFRINKKDLYFGASIGVLCNTGTQMNYYPIVGLKVGKKF